MEASWAVLRPSGGRFGALLEASWAVFEPFWGHLGPFWGDLGGLLGRLSAIGEYVTNLRFPMGMGRFLPLGALLGRRLETSWGVLKACWAVLRPSWAFWSDLSASRGPLGASGRPLGALLDRFGAPWAPKKSSGILGEESAGSLPGVCRESAGTLPGPCRGTFRPGTPRGRPARAN